MESHPPVESITFCRSSVVDNEDNTHLLPISQDKPVKPVPESLNSYLICSPGRWRWRWQQL